MLLQSVCYQIMYTFSHTRADFTSVKKAILLLPNRIYVQVAEGAKIKRQQKIVHPIAGSFKEEGEIPKQSQVLNSLEVTRIFACCYLLNGQKT